MKELYLLTADEIVSKIKNREKDFSKRKIVGADFSGMDLRGASFEGSELNWVRFADCKLVDANFANSKIDLSYFSYSDMTKAVFDNAKIYNTYFSNVILDNTSFRSADIRYVLIVDTNLDVADFSRASRIRMLTSFTELTQEDFGYVIKALGKVNLPTSNRAFALALIDNVKTITDEKMLKFYDMGRQAAANFVREAGSGYVSTADEDTYPDSTGTYVKGGSYTSDSVYGISKKERKD